MVLVGSWCLVAYREYFRQVGAIHAVRTRDIDFLVPPSAVFLQNVNVPDLMKDLGFLVGFRGEQGAMMLEHPELMIEFLVPERGRGGQSTKNLPQLGMNAQALRFMDIALTKTLPLEIGGIPGGQGTGNLNRRKSNQYLYLVLDLLYRRSIVVP